VSSSSDNPPPGQLLAPTRALIEHLSPEGLQAIGRALHAKLNAPPTPAERRVAELRYLTTLLEERPQYPERPPYVPRTLYDERRPAEAPAAPPSARLTERYGSWPRACRAAWGLLKDGRYVGDGQPWPYGAKPPKYTLSEAIASINECALALGRIPSSHEYTEWVVNRRARARATGATHRIVKIDAVLRLLAPDRSGGNGWKLVIARVFPNGYAP
jgi:hypothetical protein